MKITPAPLASLGTRKEVRRDVFGELVMKILFTTAPTPPSPPRRPGARRAPRRRRRPRTRRRSPRRPPPAGAAIARSPTPMPGADGAVTVVDLSTWDTEGDAKEAEAVATRLMAKLADADSAHDDWLVDARGRQAGPRVRRAQGHRRRGRRRGPQGLEDRALTITRLRASARRAVTTAGCGRRPPGSAPSATAR